MRFEAADDLDELGCTGSESRVCGDVTVHDMRVETGGYLNSMQYAPALTICMRYETDMEAQRDMSSGTIIGWSESSHRYAQAPNCMLRQLSNV